MARLSTVGARAVLCGCGFLGFLPVVCFDGAKHLTSSTPLLDLLLIFWTTGLIVTGFIAV
jgi:hypothetical protein